MISRVYPEAPQVEGTPEKRPDEWLSYRDSWLFRDGVHFISDEVLIINSYLLKDELYMRRKIKRRVLESTRNFIMKLSQESEDGALVVVEGPNDVRALQSLGFKGKSHMLCWNAGLSRLPSEMVMHTKIIPLLDLDKEGKALTKKVIGTAEKIGVEVDMFFWRKVVPVTEGSITEIQELIRFSDGEFPATKAD
ncbi:MAG: toprim domain-containing protein [Thaumarchaeota archaeon]|nr:toprim domain-containing protein [Nitrososphaerota archaeon]